ncbi:hypothetical protein NDR87_26330 [Nocardia sp. CDC159]|uniref:Minor tail protein n=1 Tax=Nocardia pulmonis TaxID=2951408 RepID=A0A9X2E7D3_9NOCA|nr:MULTISPECIES: hypothetical protein [Nocardia]MCM6774965.1 hypothetical protein [Nocardia pulmonis]MCM6789896.1 hypothetical protein [Nocardia sp. CDC159]
MTAPTLNGVVNGDQLAIWVRTVDGRPIGHIPCDRTTDVTWSRERNEVSRCEITTSDIDAGALVPWLHWIDIWEDGTPVWSGPVQEASTDLATGSTRIEARDVAAFLWYTRVPTTRQWQRLDPAPIAATLWQAMLELHRVDVDPTVLPPTDLVERFDFAVTANSRMLNAVMDELVRIGLDWTVVSGRPILGTLDTAPVAQLQDCDFMTSLRRVRSGKRSTCDVRVQGKNWAHTETVDMAGLHLQALISLDNMSGVANITAAARQYLREVGALRDLLEVPPGASLHPNAPLTTADLVPGSVFAVYAADMAALMRLKSVEIAWTGTNRDVRVTVDTVTEPIELDPGIGGIL